MSFERENVKKMGFLKVFTYYCTKSFWILPCCSDDARTSRIVAYLIEQGAPVIKWTTLSEEKKVLGQKTSKNGLFLGFHTILH